MATRETRRRDDGLFCFLFFSFLSSAGVRENRCCVACEERASVFEEIEIEGKIAPEVRGSTETGRTRVTDSIAWVNPRDFNGVASFFRSTRASLFFRFRRLRDRPEMFLRDASSRNVCTIFHQRAQV